MMKKYFNIFLLLLAFPFMSVNAQSVIYASRLLEQMAKMMQMTDTIKRMPEGVSVSCYNYKGLPVTVVKSGNQVKHIGYSVFTEQQRKDIGEIRSNFVERFLLTTDLPFAREKSVEMEMQEEKIVFRTGSLAALKGFIKDKSCSVEAELVKEKLHTVKWKKVGKAVCEMGFPANHELMAGRNMLENDERLQMDIVSVYDTVINKQRVLEEKSLQKHHEIYVQHGGNYMFKELTADRYFIKNVGNSFSPLCTPMAPRESFANLMTDNDIENNYMLDVTLKQYNYKQSEFSIPLTKWIVYYKEQGFKPYFCIIGQDKNVLDCLLILRNADMGCNHVMRLSFDTETLAYRKGKIKARLNSFVPTSNLKDIYYENKL